MTRIIEVFTDSTGETSTREIRIWVAEHDGEQIGEIMLDLKEDITFDVKKKDESSKIAFVSNLVVAPNMPKEIASMLIQKVIGESRKRGFDRLLFTIDPETPSLLQLVKSGKAQIERILASVAI